MGRSCNHCLGGLCQKRDVPLFRYRYTYFHIDKLNKKKEEFIKQFSSSLWDLGLAPGIQIKSLDELLEPSNLDDIVKNSLIDNRFIAGSFLTYTKFESIVKNYILNRGKYDF